MNFLWSRIQKKYSICCFHCAHEKNKRVKDVKETLECRSFLFTLSHCPIFAFITFQAYRVLYARPRGFLPVRGKKGGGALREEQSWIREYTKNQCSLRGEWGSLVRPRPYFSKKGILESLRVFLFRGCLSADVISVLERTITVVSFHPSFYPTKLFVCACIAFY